MLYWLLLLTLLGAAARLSQPELARWLRDLLARRLAARLPARLGGARLGGAGEGGWSGSLAPAAPPLRRYEHPDDLSALDALAAPHAALADEVERWAARVALRAARRAPALSPRLTAAAALACELAERGQPALRAADLRFLCEHVGLAGEPPAVTLRAVDPSAPPALIPALLEDALAAAVLSAAPRVELGVASLTAPSGARWVALLARGVRCLTSPLPKQLAGAVGAQGRGELLEGARLSLWVTDPGGLARRAPLTQRGASFSWALSGLARGAHAVELSAQGAAGPVVVLRFTLHQGAAPPAEHALRAPAAPPWAPLGARRLAAHAQRARALAGLRPLDRSAPLGALAAELLAEEERAQGAAALSLQGARARLAAPHASALLALERLSGVDLADLAEQLLSSPRRRARLLDPNVTHIGVATRRGAAGGLEGLCLLSAQPARLSPARDLAEAYRVIQDHRKAHGAPRLPVDPALGEVAEEVARAISAGGCRPTEAAPHAAHLLQARGAPEALLAALHVQALPLRRAAALPPQASWLEEPVGVGVGLAQSAPSAPIWAVVALRLRPRPPGEAQAIAARASRDPAPQNSALQDSAPQNSAPRDEGRDPDDLWADEQG